MTTTQPKTLTLGQRIARGLLGRSQPKPAAPPTATDNPTLERLKGDPLFAEAYRAGYEGRGAEFMAAQRAKAAAAPARRAVAPAGMPATGSPTAVRRPYVIVSGGTTLLETISPALALAVWVTARQHESNGFRIGGSRVRLKGVTEAQINEDCRAMFADRTTPLSTPVETLDSLFVPPGGSAACEIEWHVTVDPAVGGITDAVNDLQFLCANHAEAADIFRLAHAKGLPVEVIAQYGNTKRVFLKFGQTRIERHRAKQALDEARGEEKSAADAAKLSWSETSAAVDAARMKIAKLESGATKVSGIGLRRE